MEEMPIRENGKVVWESISHVGAEEIVPRLRRILEAEGLDADAEIRRMCKQDAGA